MTYEGGGRSCAACIGYLGTAAECGTKGAKGNWDHGAESINKMTLESVNAPFSRVGAVRRGWHNFQFVFVLMTDDVPEFLWTFIVHLVDGWTESPFFQVGKDLLVDSDVFCNRAVFHGVYNNSICVKDVTHNYVVVSPA